MLRAEPLAVRRWNRLRVSYRADADTPRRAYRLQARAHGGELRLDDNRPGLAVELSLPGAPWALAYRILAHTGTSGELPRKRLSPGSTVTLPARTVVVFGAEVLTGVRPVPVSPVTPDEAEADVADAPDTVGQDLPPNGIPNARLGL